MEKKKMIEVLSLNVSNMESELMRVRLEASNLQRNLNEVNRANAETLANYDNS
jgi:hypothetical protein